MINCVRCNTILQCAESDKMQHSYLSQLRLILSLPSLKTHALKPAGVISIQHLTLGCVYARSVSTATDLQKRQVRVKQDGFNLAGQMAKTRTNATTQASSSHSHTLVHVGRNTRSGRQVSQLSQVPSVRRHLRHTRLVPVIITFRNLRHLMV